MTLRRTLALGLVAAATLAGVVAAQAVPEQTPRGALTGTAIDGRTDEPMSGAVVSIAAVPARLLPGQTRQVTDDRGRFAFVNLPGDTRYTLSASKFGYLDGGFGRDSAPTDPLRPIPLGRDEWIGNLRVPLWTPGAIAGVVRDESGEPVVGVFVRVVRRIAIYGRDDLAAGPMTTTDDRGAYRVSGLPPGRYVVQVPSVQASVPAGVTITQPRIAPPDGIVDADDSHRLVIGRYPLPPPPVDGRRLAYPPTFHPSTSTFAQAATIDLAYGDDRANVDLTLTPVPTSRISGVVHGPPEARQSLTLRLLPAGLEGTGLGSEAATALVAADGTFTFTNVPAGAYVIDAPATITELSSASFDVRNPNRLRFPVPPTTQGFAMSSDGIDLIPGLSIVNTSYRSATGYAGRATVTASGTDIDGAAVHMQPLATMTGRVVVEPDPAQPDVTPPGRFPVRLDPASGYAPLGWPRTGVSDGPPDRFAIENIPPGRFWLRVQGFPAWLVKSVVWNGRDHARMPIDAAPGAVVADVVVTITNAVPVLSGAVRGSEALDADAAMVIAFPAEPSTWRDQGLWPAHLKMATVSSARTFELASLPAGDYLVAAVDRTLAPSWRDPRFLQKIAPLATRVSLTWGSKASVDLTTVVAR